MAIQITDGIRSDHAQVNKHSQLLVCLCNCACKGTVTLDELQNRYPGLNISIQDISFTDIIRNTITTKKSEENHG